MTLEEDFEITDSFQGYFPELDSIKNDVSNPLTLSLIN